MFFSSTLYLPLALLLISACAPVLSSAPTAGTVEQEQPLSGVAGTPALPLHALSTVQGILPELANRRVVFIGEQHTRYEHHLVQLEIIRGMHQRNPRLAIGLEMFQQPFQQVLDDYVDGRIDEQQMLRDTEYFQRWRVDYRQYAPILRFAREQGVQLIALNLPVELTRAVGRSGIAGLEATQRAELPDSIDRSDAAYSQRLKSVFDQHPNQHGQPFENFLDVQLLWDEGMAQRAAEFLRARPDYQLVVLAGVAHVAYGSPIPRRLMRRIDVDMATVIMGWDTSPEPELGDYLLWPEPDRLPPAGRIGALLEESDDALLIEACVDDSPCAGAGLKAGDRIVTIDAMPIVSLADLRLALWDRAPGDSVTLEIQRQRVILPDTTRQLQITLE